MVGRDELQDLVVVLKGVIGLLPVFREYFYASLQYFVSLEVLSTFVLYVKVLLLP